MPRKPKTPKYSNYTELAAAFKSGELGKGYHMMMDNGGTQNSLNYYNEDETDEENEKKQEACDDLFKLADNEDGHIEALYAALGIPAEWC